MNFFSQLAAAKGEQEEEPEIVDPEWSKFKNKIGILHNTYNDGGTHPR
jgi:hypothetical protein